MVNVCFVNALFPPDFRGGAENYVLRTAKALRDRGHGVSVITTQEFDGLSSLRPRKTTVEGVPVWRFYPAKAVWHQIDTVNPHASYVCGRLVDDLDPDVVHTNNLMGISTTAARSIQKRDVRHVHTLHDYSLICPKSNLLREWTAPDDELVVCEDPPAPCRAYGSEKRALIGQPDVVTAPSQHVIDVHRQHGFFNEAETRRVQLGIEGVADEPPDVPADPTVLYVGKHLRAKGLDTLFKAVERHGDVEFHFCGTGPYDERTAACAREQDNATYHGYVSEGDLQRLRRQASVGVVPSIWMENSPMTIYESFAAGLPVVASDIGGIPELVEPGETGFLFEPGGPAALAAAARRLFDADGVALSRAALAWAGEHTMTAHLDRLVEEVYRL
jgi:glycosyltransferase involved in cell wall biosynthesis